MDNSKKLNIFNVAARLCELSKWQVSHLTIQKATYIAQMLYLGQHDGVSLFEEDFEAWDRGPVCPALYSKIKESDKVQNNIIPNGLLEVASNKVIEKYEDYLMSIHEIIPKISPFSISKYYTLGEWCLGKIL